MAALLALVAGGVVTVIAVTVFPYHSVNHDEAVYLMQAAMVLNGQLEIYAEPVADAFRPWFFVADGSRFYPKYSPVPAMAYAVAMAAGEPRLTLGAVTATSVGLVYLLARETVDRTVGVVAAACFAMAPMSLITAATFLPYAPTTCLNLLFAVCYLHADRTGSRPVAGVAGLAIGLAFFARPFTAVLFAVPFCVHAAWTVYRDWAEGTLSGALIRQSITALGGLFLVGVTLAYNARLTGSPGRFPYQAFAPQDGPGFGIRSLLGYTVEYTPDLAVRANALVLEALAARWFTGGLLGTALAGAGLVLAARRWFPTRKNGVERLSIDRQASAVLAGLVVTVIAGNLLFWGNLNIIGDPGDPGDGFIADFGPFYHFDLLVPLSIFAAIAVVAGARWLAHVQLIERTPGSSAVTAGGLVVATLLVTGGITVGLVGGPLTDHASRTDTYETAYEPIENTQFERAVVFVPTPYGDWLHHPFQYLRNRPTLDGPVVYALEGPPDRDFSVLDRFSNRTPYRYTYRGRWTRDSTREVTPKLEQLRIKQGTALVGTTTVGVPDRVERATIRLTLSEGGLLTDSRSDPRDALKINWSVENGAVQLADQPERHPVDGAETVVLSVTLVGPQGSTLTYRQRMRLRTDGNHTEIIWPPTRRVCALVTACDRTGTYLPERQDRHRPGVAFDTALTVSTAHTGS